MLKQLKYFQSVVRLGSFSAAAEENFISQSAISQQVQSLERELSFALLVRKNRSFSLTPAGEYFYRKSLLLTDNLFETGGSYGGFMTNWIIGHTDRFRACASQRSISNWTSFYGVSDIGPDFSEDQCGSTIWPDVDQGYQMYSALIAHGVESRLVLFRGENHELSRSGKPKHRIRRLNEITGWFEQHKG